MTDSRNLFDSQNSGRYREEPHMDKPDPNLPKYQGRDGAELLDSDMRRWKLDQSRDAQGGIASEANQPTGSPGAGMEWFWNPNTRRHESRPIASGNVTGAKAGDDAGTGALGAAARAAAKKRADEAASMKSPGQTGLPTRDQFDSDSEFKKALDAHRQKEDEKKARAKANANTMRQ